MRARGKEAGDKLQHLMQMNPRKAGLIGASVHTNATPDIHPQSEQYWGRRRQDIGHSYFKRAPQVRLGGKVGEGNDDDLMLAEKSDLLIGAMKPSGVPLENHQLMAAGIYNPRSLEVVPGGDLHLPRGIRCVGAPEEW